MSSAVRDVPEEQPTRAMQPVSKSGGRQAAEREQPAEPVPRFSEREPAMASRFEESGLEQLAPVV